MKVAEKRRCVHGSPIGVLIFDLLLHLLEHSGPAVMRATVRVAQQTDVVVI
jgi:hypothetical protein